MPKYGPQVARLVNEETGEEIQPGDQVVTFREETVIFQYVSRLPEPGKGGKIVVKERFLNLHNVVKELEREYFPSVLEARIELVGE